MNNPLLVKKSKLFLSESLKNMKSEIPKRIKDKEKNKTNKKLSIKNCMNFKENKKLLKY